MRGIQGGRISFCILAGMHENAETSSVALATCIFVSIQLVPARNSTLGNIKRDCKAESCLSPLRSILRHIRAFKLVGIGKRTGDVLLILSACKSAAAQKDRSPTERRTMPRFCACRSLKPCTFAPRPNTGPAARIHAGSSMFQYSFMLFNNRECHPGGPVLWLRKKLRYC